MKIFWKVLRIIGAVMASLLTPVLIILLMTAPVAKSASMLVNPRSLHEIIQKIDTRELVNSAPELKDVLREAGVSASALDAVLESDIMSDFIDLYAEDMEAQLFDGQKQTSITANDLLRLAEKHMDDLVDIAREHFSDKVKGKSYSEISRDITNAVNKHAPEIIKSLSGLADIFEELDPDDTKAAYLFIKGSMMALIYAAIILLSLMIFACRAYHLEGTVWLGISYSVAAVFMFLIPAISDGILDLIGNSASTGIISTALSVFIEVCAEFAVAYVIIGVLFIAAFVAVRVMYSLKKKKAKHPAPAYVPAPHPQPAPVYTQAPYPQPAPTYTQAPCPQPAEQPIQPYAEPTAPETADTPETAATASETDNQ